MMERWLTPKSLGNRCEYPIFRNLTMILTREYRSPAGVCVKDSCFAVDNGLNSFDLHDLNNGAYIRMFVTGLLRFQYPWQARLTEDGGLLVGGGEYGRVHMFDSQSGATLGTLKYGGDSLVQNVDVSQLLPLFPNTLLTSRTDNWNHIKICDRRCWFRCLSTFIHSNVVCPQTGSPSDFLWTHYGPMPHSGHHHEACDDHLCAYEYVPECCSHACKRNKAMGCWLWRS